MPSGLSKPYFASSAAIVASDLAFSELKGLAGIACIVKKVIMTTRKIVRIAMPSRFSVYIANRALMGYLPLYETTDINDIIHPE